MLAIPVVVQYATVVYFYFILFCEYSWHTVLVSGIQYNDLTSVCYARLTTNVAPICRMQRYDSITDDIPCAVPFIPIVVLICTSFMSNDTGHFFMGLLANNVSFFGKCFMLVFCPFKRLCCLPLFY